ncbi:hypothetical protein TSUD_263460 [Trifolium subterraneum]|uniref:Uncharacterized protein n=1 Tax=Trifolium subterraneum TaxID=3900 RepID=A0A2Z6NAC8_TRISU|nr:hypothetical protein TSUD_263460 [Trifolium subterraneum]
MKYIRKRSLSSSQTLSLLSKSFQISAALPYQNPNHLFHHVASAGGGAFAFKAAPPLLSCRFCAIALILVCVGLGAVGEGGGALLLAWSNVMVLVVLRGDADCGYG